MGHCDGTATTKKVRENLLMILGVLCILVVTECTGRRVDESYTACEHLRRAESRRAKALFDSDGPKKSVRVPRCTTLGDFEPIQCLNETSGQDCWCVDDYGVELPGTRRKEREDINCNAPSDCPGSSCRMFCPSGFDRDARSGCPICKCRDPCDGIECPGGQQCQPQEVECKAEPCPPVPTCKKARSLMNLCPAGQPLSIEGTVQPFLCGRDPGKPLCPPLYECLVESGNDYGVCCPSSLEFKKPGVCPAADDTEYQEVGGHMCGTPCNHDLECAHMEKCCFTKGCQHSCQQPINITMCHQARALSEIMAVNEREGRGYVPECNGPGGTFSPKQCSRNGLVCWCVDSRTGHKIKETMGAADMVNCDGIENTIMKATGRSVNMEQCDSNICAAVCEYGFKNDHNGCPTCECSTPCEGFICPLGSHCEVASDPLCESGSALCASLPVCKPDLSYSNPCDVGTPLTDNSTGEVYYCHQEGRQSRNFQSKSFFDEEEKEGRAMTNKIHCPEKYTCTKLHREPRNVCCPIPEETTPIAEELQRQQSMCEYLRSFSDRMEGTEEGMQLAIAPPTCTADGSYTHHQCMKKKMTVTRGEQRKILEQNAIREMRQLLSGRSKREASSTERLHLYPVTGPQREHIQGRSAKVISTGPDNLQSIHGKEDKLSSTLTAYGKTKGNLVDVEVEECWCVDGFGTEIPSTRGLNVTEKSCLELKESVDCLDLTCRMGCEYGFILDPETKCPVCNCRDPCDGITCPDGKECRTVEVSCEGEYCPPVPACLPRKPGQCPFLVPPGPDNVETNACNYECRSDFHCDGNRRCCSNGCGTQCVEPQMKTACEHLRSIQMHQASELGIPAKQIYIAQCDRSTGNWNQVQCGPNKTCWCVDESGQEISGTRVTDGDPVCKVNSAFECPLLKCSPCESGYKVDNNGCQTCECRNLCDEISCMYNEECQLVSVECISGPCPKMPLCVPRRESECPEGEPLRQNGKDIICGPQNKDESCPTTHSCQLNPMTNRGVCCAKTRDVCFDSIDSTCIAKDTKHGNSTKWRFSPKTNKCVPVYVAEKAACQSKNIFHSESACKSVCPALSPCERLKLKNSLAAKRTGHLSVWFQPRCDPVTGQWSPIQCLGKQPSRNEMSTGRGFSFADESSPGPANSGVCWCADKKGAPLKGTLTRDLEPVCNHRQARRMEARVDATGDPLMEELVRQLTILADDKENEVFDEIEPIPIEFAAQTEIVESLSQVREKEVTKSTTKLMKTTTRCRSLSDGFNVVCDENGAFLPIQCSGDQCWCVDAAGNQLPNTSTFKIATKQCLHTPIDSVSIEIRLMNKSGKTIANIYEILRSELVHMLGPIVENLRVHEDVDGSVDLKFDLHTEDKIDIAFALEEMMKKGDLTLGTGLLNPDITLSHIVHHRQSTPLPQLATGIHENTFQIIIFVLATSSAFLVSILVVYIMLKRGRKKTMSTYPNNRVLGTGDKYLDYSSPIFVLNAEDSAKFKVEDMKN